MLFFFSLKAVLRNKLSKNIGIWCKIYKALFKGKMLAMGITWQKQIVVSANSGPSASSCQLVTAGVAIRVRLDVL